MFVFLVYFPFKITTVHILRAVPDHFIFVMVNHLNSVAVKVSKFKNNYHT